MRLVEHINEEDFNIVVRKGKVILSAPHAIKQVRKGKGKKSETKTKYLVDKVSRRTNCSCIYKTKCLNDDANYDDYSYYREKCSEVIKKKDIKFLLDIHGMSAKRRQDICIGTARGKNINNNKEILSSIVKIFKDNDFKNVSIDKPFSSSNKNCVSSHIHKKCKIITFQIEINYKYLSIIYNEYNLNKIVNVLTQIVEYLKSCIE